MRQARRQHEVRQHGSSSSGRHASSDEGSTTGRHSSTPSHSTPSHSTPKHGATGDDYTVVAGDTLASIADAHQVSGGWKALAAGNSDVAAHPDMIMPGQHLRLTGTGSPA